MKWLMMITGACMMLSAASCIRVHTDPIEVKPITLNINVKVDRQLDDFFGPIENKNATTQPTTVQ